MRKAFLAKCVDFVNFDQEGGIYFETEREYKDALIREAQSILSTDKERSDPKQVGHAFLSLLDPKRSNFVGWRTYAQIANAGSDSRDLIATALGEMVLSEETAPLAVATAATRIHPLLSATAEGKPAFAQVRTLVTSALALARPADAICVKTRVMQRAAKVLIGRTLLKTAVVDAEEYSNFLILSFRIRDAMTEWDWKPRDLWDVQSFLWVVDDSWLPQAGTTAEGMEDDMEEDTTSQTLKHPLNQILFGPPGTGKTWTTTRLAVEICNGFSPSDRKELKQAYHKLIRTNRVAFTTFHQSLGYEEFVEGLRPVTDEDGQQSTGFRLEPRKGVFREICTLAERARTLKGKRVNFDFSGRRFFKMSLGQAGKKTTSTTRQLQATT